MSFYLKDPDAAVDYAIDWAPYLDGRTIVASDWSIAPVEATGCGTGHLARDRSGVAAGSRPGSRELSSNLFSAPTSAADTRPAG